MWKTVTQCCLSIWEYSQSHSTPHAPENSHWILWLMVKRPTQKGRSKEMDYWKKNTARTVKKYYTWRVPQVTYTTSIDICIIVMTCAMTIVHVHVWLPKCNPLIQSLIVAYISHCIPGYPYKISLQSASYIPQDPHTIILRSHNIRLYSIISQYISIYHNNFIIYPNDIQITSPEYPQKNPHKIPVWYKDTTGDGAGCHERWWLELCRPASPRHQDEGLIQRWAVEVVTITIMTWGV